MKKRSVLLMLCLFAASCGRETPPAVTVSLIPDSPGKTPSYWCTWGAQNYAADEKALAAATGLEGHSIAADRLTERNMFGSDGWAQTAFRKVRPDLYVVYDVGWDVEAGVHFDNERWRLGSLEVAASKFPSANGTPAERLRRLNEMTKAAGWRGAGLWVAAQPYGDGKEGKACSDSETESFFRERLRWSKDAGIEYWKVDYGRRNNPGFRRMLTRLGREEAPGLWIEHSRGGGPLNDEECPWDVKDYTGKGNFTAWGNGSVLRRSAELVSFSQVFRTYDVTPHLSIPTTLERVAQLLAEFSGRTEAAGLLNCEDEVYIGAVLGTAVGVMRHPGWKDPQLTGYDPLELRARSDEVVRAVRWQRISPAFGVGATTVTLDEARLDDTWTFRSGDTWARWVVGRTVVQSAPARVARNMPLPEIRGNIRPYVIASRNPNGAVSVATLPRISSERGFYHPLVDVTLDVHTLDAPVGVFGSYRSLVLRFPGDVSGRRVLAQDLAGDEAIDITGQVVCQGREITIDGKLIDRIGRLDATPGDLSEPGLVVKFVPKDQAAPKALQGPVVASFEWTGDRAGYPPARPEQAAEVGPIVDYFASAGAQIHGDTCPMTWADDGEIYASSGDPNWGGKPDGLDVEKFSGYPPDYSITRVNPMNDYRGNGGHGQKPSGMICIDGILYLGFQNLEGKKQTPHVSRSQHGSDAAVVASRNHGLTWSPAIKDIKAPMFPGSSFGGPAFVNFGRNNAGARDGYVYAVSTDQWDNGSHLRLGRVSTGRILESRAWQWVAGFARDGQPLWTSDLNHAIPILSRYRQISLPEVVYLAPLKRYLLLTWSLYRDFDPDQGSRLDIYEAPEPWGPFTLVHQEVPWETAEVTPYCPRLPLKWIAATDDGVTGWLQFSGSWRKNSLEYRSHVRPFRIRARAAGGQPRSPEVRTR
jgi:hypothetical protein